MKYDAVAGLVWVGIDYNINDYFFCSNCCFSKYQALNLKRRKLINIIIKIEKGIDVALFWLIIEEFFA